jgi:hypothetical protein
MATAAWIPWTLALGLGATSVAAFLQGRDHARRLETLESMPTAPVPRAPGAPGEGPSLVVGGGPAFKADLDTLAQEVKELRARLAAGAKPGTGGAGGAAPGSAAFELGVRDVLARVQDEPEFKAKVAAAGGAQTLAKKPTFGALAEHLALDANQQRDFRRDLEDIQGSLFALLSEKRPDGRVLMEEIVAVESLPEGDPKRATVFLELFTLKIPGSEETYVARAVTLATNLRTNAQRYLRPEQQSRFASLDVDLFGVKMD